MRIRVECYAGYRGEETPRCLVFDGRAVDVAEVVDRWLAPEHRYFKLRGGDEAIYIIRHDVPTDAWDMVSFLSAEAGEPMTATMSSGVRKH